MSHEIPIGAVLDTERAATLIAQKLNRHTFWCGQSGSGKTYALGVVLEQVLLVTALPLVILDPNSDFVRLGEVRPDAPAEAAAQLRDRDIRVFRPRDAERPLRVRYVDMPVRSRAAILDVDPVLDAEEYNTMLKLESEFAAIAQAGNIPRGADLPHGGLVKYLRRSDDPLRLRLAMRLENLGVADWEVWAWGGRAVTDDIDERPDATVVDLGGFHTPAESRAAALAVLDHLWERREDRVGRLIVIDEAHNLCRPDPETAVEARLTERIVQIAAEGRKYGLWLLLSTQRPSKVHPNALSQCDNLALMRMSSTRDLDELAGVFGYAPEELLQRSPGFAQGQSLFAGGFVAEPSLVQLAERLTHEGGGDVSVPLR